MNKLVKMFRKNQIKTLDMVLTHDGENWIASNKTIKQVASSLGELDLKIENALRDEFADGKRLNVFMAFDNEAIPMWIRPYMNHYFNRILVLPIQR